MSYKCIKPQCGLEVHPDDYHERLHCYCGAPVRIDGHILVKVICEGKEVNSQKFDLPTMIKVGRGGGLLMNAPHIDLKPYLQGKKSISRSHLSMYVTEDHRVRVCLESTKNGIVLNHISMLPGVSPTTQSLPLNIKLNKQLSLKVESR